MSIDFISCQGLAGFLDLGFVEQGFELQHRTGTLDFGNAMINANRQLVGDKWDYHFSPDSTDWYTPKQHVPVVSGLPPCSGWSCWTDPASRGPQAKAHEHTREFMRYVGRIRPEIAVFECVGQAYTQGREVMLEYRDMVEQISGLRYELHHVKMNNAMIGGFSFRARYFWVAVREGIPFAPYADWPDKIPTILDVIGDLAEQPESWSAQPYVAPPTTLAAASLRDQSNTVDGHIGNQNLQAQRITDTVQRLEELEQPWQWGEALSVALERVHRLDGRLPASWDEKAARMIERKFDMGFSVPYRWAGDVWANVLTSGCLNLIVHPTMPRCITHREAARLQGLPDSWSIEATRSYGPMQDTWGKAVSKNAGSWVAGHVRESLEGRVSFEDQETTGHLIGDREWLHETDKGFSRQGARKRYFPGTKGGITRAYNPELWPLGHKPPTGALIMT